MRLRGVVMSPSMKTFICLAAPALGELGRLQSEDPVHTGQVMMEGSRQTRLQPGSFVVQGGNRDSPDSQLYSALKENDFFFFARSLLWEVGMRADTLSCLAGFCWLTHLVCFLHPERGTGVGGWEWKSIREDRSRVWSAVEPSLRVLQEGRKLIWGSLLKPYLFQTSRAQPLWARRQLLETAVPRYRLLVHTT